MSMTRTFKSKASVLGFSVARQSLRLGRVYGYFIGADANNKWLQLHTGTLDASGNVVAPANGTVPTVSFLLQQNFEFVEQFDSNMTLVKGPVYAVVSTTEATLTKATGADTADITIEAEEFELQPPTLTSVTDTNLLTVWDRTQQPKLIYDVVVKTDSVIGPNDPPVYLLLFACDGGDLTAAKDIPLCSWKLPASGYLVLNFGSSGFSPVQQGLRSLNQSIPPAALPKYDGMNTRGCLFVTSNDILFVSNIVNSTITARYF